MYSNSQGFLGMDVHVQAVDTRPSFLLPRGLRTRLTHIDIHTYMHTHAHTHIPTHAHTHVHT